MISKIFGLVFVWVASLIGGILGALFAIAFMIYFRLCDIRDEVALANVLNDGGKDD
jgi:hypothetical protein